MAFRTDGSSALKGDNPVRKSERESIRPNNFAKSDDKKSGKIINFNEARDRLRGGEDAASGAVDETADNLDATQAAEENPDFINSVTGNNDKKTKGKGFLGGKGPIGLLITLLLGVGGGIAGMNSFLPFSLAEQLRETFDSISTSTNTRSKVFLKYQLNTKTTNDPVKTKLFGSNEFKISDKQKSKLAKQGIYTAEAELSDGTKKTVLLQTTSDGTMKIVTADSSDVSKISSDGALKLTSLSGDIDTDLGKYANIEVADFDTKFGYDADFRNSYKSGAMTWRGSIGAWFDSVTENFLHNNVITRNLFKDLDSEVEVVENDDGSITKVDAEKKATQNLMADHIEEEDISLSTRVTEENTTVDDDGNTNTTIDVADGGDLEVDTKTMNKRDAIHKTLESYKSNTGAKVTSIASMATNIACGVTSVIGSISILVAAQESLQIVQVATSYLEAIDKAKAGDGTDSPINTVANSLMTTFTNSYEQDDGSTIEVTGTAMEANAVQALYSNTATNAQDESISSFNISSKLGKVLKAVSLSMESYAVCAAAKIVAATAGLVSDAVGIVTCIISWGIGCVVDAIGDAGTSIVGEIAIAEAVSIAVTTITPYAVKAFTRDLISDLAGEDFGNAIVSGANKYMGGNHLSGGGSLATRDEYIAFKAQQDIVLAEEAEYERSTRSPFDASSQYTFLGSLLTSLVPLATSSTSITSTISSIANTTQNSLIALLPTASAYEITEDLLPSQEDYENTCPYLASINAVGDSFCNPYMITDVSTLEMDPYDVVDTVVSLGGLDDETGEIVEGSNLEQYIQFCSGRTSQFGVADQNISSYYAKTDIDTGLNVADTAANTIVGAIPMVGDALEVTNNAIQLANLGWITGESCVAGDTTSYEGVTSSNWNENMYYQRYVEDQRLLESTLDDYTSAVTAYWNEYYEENPLDNSYEGILARYSGLEKDTVVAILDYMDYQEYLAEYDPTTRYSFVEEQTESDPIFVESINLIAGEFGSEPSVLLDPIYYADLRGRTATAI